MKKQFNIEGMSCNHCRTSVENALNSIEGIFAIVTLDPAIAEIEFSSNEKTLPELQEVVSSVGDYKLSENKTNCHE